MQHTTKPWKMRHRPLLVLLFLITFSWAQDGAYQAILLDKDLTENANAIVRLDQMDINISSTKQMTYTVKQVVTVLNRLGDKTARTRVGYDKETKIKDIEAFVYDKMGREIAHFKKKDFQDVSAADGFSLYLDDRMLEYRYTPTQYPYTVEFTYELVTSDTGAFPAWYFLSNYLVSVEKSRFNIIYANEALKPVIKEFNLSGIKFSKIAVAGRISYSADKIPAVKMESLSPGFGKITPRLSVRLPNFYYKGNDAAINNWKELGTWIDERLLTGKTQLTEGTKNKVQSMVGGISDDLEKAKIIYKYVQDNTRYISVQIGIGGLQPISAIEVDRVKYGDCKGLSNYTKALLEVAGVASYYTVIQAGNEKVDFDADFADLRQGNHAILAIPYKDRYYWIDCTSQTLPFGFVGDFTDDRKALVVTPNGGEIVRTVSYLNEQNYQNTKAIYNITSEGGIEGEVNIDTKGIQYDNRYRLEIQTKEDIIKHYKEYWSDINNLNINTYDFQNNRNEVMFSEKVNFKASNYVSKSGDRILFTVNALNKSSFVPDRYRDRTQPFEIPRGYYDEDEFVVTLPANYSVEALPDIKETETEFGTYKMNLKYDAGSNTVLYKRNLLIKEGSYPSEKYNLYRDFRKQVASADNAQIVLVKTKL